MEYSSLKKNYFAVTSVILVLFSVIGFSDNLFFNVHQPSNSDPKFIVHGLCMFAWFLILMVQTLFIRNGDTKAHIRWGTAGFLAAASTVVSTLYVFAAVYKGWDAMPFFAKANRFFMPSFGLFVWLGYRNRQKPVLHKHYIFLGSFFLLEPILARFPLDFLTDPEFDVFLFGTWSLFFLSFFLYDWLVLKKIYPITWLSFFGVVLVYTIAILT